MTSEIEFANAVKSLTARLESWGVTEPHDKAHAYVRDMIRMGWRATGYRYEEPPSCRPAPSEAPDQWLNLARAELARIKQSRMTHPTSPSASRDESESAE